MTVAVPRGRAPLAGLAAAGSALGVSELLAGLVDRVPSLVLSVAGLLIAETPGGIVRWSIDSFGASQKTLLVTGIVVGSLLAGAVVGVAARRSLRPAVAGFVAFGALGASAAGRDSLESDAWGWFAAAVSSLVGIGCFAILRVGATPAVATSDGDPAARGPIGAVDRRRFLAATSAIALLSAASGEVGRRLRQSRTVEAARERIAASFDRGPPPTVPTGVATFDGVVAGLSPLVTPNEDFYRIDTRVLVPQVDPDAWSLRITGMVDHEAELTLDELLAMDRISEFVTLACVSNEVGGDLIGNALWSGVPLADLLHRAGAHREATQIVGRAVDGWTAGFPAEVVADRRPCMVAVAMNGEPLPVKHGFPVRLIIPGLYGYVSATKWLTEIELTTWEAFDGYWIPRGWAKEGPIKTQSRIDVPRAGATVAAGRTAVAGVAWAPTRSVEGVEVSVDDGSWEPAELSGALSANTWVQWRYTWQATAGTHRVAVRATDGDGEIQTAHASPPAPSGATGHHTVTVEVR